MMTTMCYAVIYVHRSLAITAVMSQHLLCFISSCMRTVGAALPVAGMVLVCADGAAGVHAAN